MYPHQWGCSSAQNRISTVDIGHDNCQKPYKESVGDWHMKKFDSDFSQGVPYESALTSQFAFLYLFSLFYSPAFRPCINMDWCDCDRISPNWEAAKLLFKLQIQRNKQLCVQDVWIDLHCDGISDSPRDLRKTLRLSGARRILSRITESPPWPCGEMRRRSCQEPISTVLITASKGRLL